MMRFDHKKNVVVTGGAGFIGSHLVEELMRQGAHVVVLDNEFNGKKENLKDAYEVKEGYLEYRKVDINDPNIDLACAMIGTGSKGVEYVFHLAAVASVPRSVKDPVSTFETNVMGTLKLLIACRDLGVKRVVFSSSSSVYGDDQTMPKTENSTGKTLSPYALSKHIGEELLRQFYELYKLETVSLRYFNVFGPRQDPDGPYAAVIPLFVKQMVNGERPTIFGDGKQTRDFTYVKNVVEGTILFARVSNKVCGHAFNIACGNKITLNELVYCINKELKTKLMPKYREPRIGDVLHSSADSTKAKLFGFDPKISFEDGLKETIASYREEK